MSDSLTFAITHGKLESIETLMVLGAEMNESGFLQAIKRGDLAIFQLLIDRGWDVNSTEFGKTAL